MTREEREQISSLPEKYQPLSPWVYFAYTILYSIPVVGFVFLIINSLSGGNINKRNFARSYFCIFVILIILVIVIFATGLGAALLGGAN